MNSQRRILLINPTITSRRSARFPLGNVDRRFNSPSRLARPSRDVPQAEETGCMRISQFGGDSAP